MHAQFFKSLGIFGSKNAREYTGYSWLNGGKNPPKGIFLSIYANLVWKTSFLPRIMVRKSENTENLQKISTTDPMINGFCGSIALTENLLITSSLDWFGVNQQIKLLSYKKDISGNWIKSDELVLPCDNDCDIADIDVSNNIIAATRFGVSSNLDDETIIEESYVQLFSINPSGRIQHLPSLPHKIYSDDVDSYFGWSISNNGNHVILGAPASTNGIISDKPQGAFYYFKIPMVGFSVPAMGGIGLLALGLSMLGLGAVRLRRK